MILSRQDAALKVLCSLLSNPERYKYIADKVGGRELSNSEATQKNIDKAYKIADQFLKTKS